ncbi:putative ribonuclease H-like domain-containing protein [Tanacetum coccineum]
MRPFGYPVTILSTIDHLGKFDGKADEGFFVGYSTNSKAFRVFNSRIRIVEESLHVQFIVVENQSNGNAGTKACADVVYGCADDPNIPDLEEISRFSDAENDDSGADINNLDTYFQVSPVPTTRIHKDHPLNQVIGDLQLATQTRQMTKNLEEYGFKEPKKVVQALKDPSWIKAMQEELLQFKLQQRTDRQNLFIKRDQGDILIVQVYVDDIIFGSTKKKLCTKFEKMMHKKFQMSSMGELTFFLGLQVKQKEDGIFISQDKYVTEILKKFGFSDVKTANTPMETHKPLLKDADGEDIDEHMYRSMIGSLMYLTSSRPDIMFVCKKQTVVAISITEAEYVAASILVYCLHAKTVNGEVQLQALVDGKKIVVTEASVRRDLQLEDANGVDCLPNATIFEQLTLMGYEKLLQKLTFYKAFFSPQWKFLIHTILQCLSAKTTAWNEFSSTMASAIICLANNQKFNFSKYIFESMMKNLDSAVKFLMYPRFVQVFLDNSTEGMMNHNKIYIAPSHTEKVFANIKRQGKDFSGRVTPLFSTMTVQAQQEQGEGLDMPTITQPSSSQPQKKHKPRKPKKKDTQIPQSNVSSDNLAYEALEIDSLKRRVKKLEKKQRSRTRGLRRLYKVGLSARVVSSEDEGLGEEDASKQGRKIHDIDADEDITLENVHDEDMFDTCVFNDEEVFAGQDMAEKEVSTTDPVTTTGEVVTTANVEVSTASPTAATITTIELTLAQTLAQLKSARPKTKGVVMLELSETTTKTTTIPSKDKGKGIMVEEPLKMKKKDQLFDKAMKRVNTFVDMNIELVGGSEVREEGSEIKEESSSKRTREELESDKSKKQKLDEKEVEVDDAKEAEELKKCLEIVPDDGDDVTIDATPLSVKILIVDYKIYQEGKKSFFKIIKADGKTQMYYKDA